MFTQFIVARCTQNDLPPSLHPSLIVQGTETRQLHLSDHQLATALSAQMTKHIFRSRESVMAAQLNTPQKLRDPGPKPSAVLYVFNILKSLNTNQKEGSKENQTRKAQISDLHVSYMNRTLTPKSSHSALKYTILFQNYQEFYSCHRSKCHSYLTIF